jgi:hypothetical protein
MVIRRSPRFTSISDAGSAPKMWSTSPLRSTSDHAAPVKPPCCLGLLGSGASAHLNTLWQELFDVEIGPHHDLTASQKAVVAKDFGMEKSYALLTVRYAKLFHVLKRLNLLGVAAKLPARSPHIVVVNQAEAALEKANLSA